MIVSWRFGPLRETESIRGDQQRGWGGLSYSGKGLLEQSTRVFCAEVVPPSDTCTERTTKPLLAKRGMLITWH